MGEAGREGVLVFDAMPSVVFDASTLVGALPKSGSVPEQALLLARVHDRLCLSAAVEGEVRTTAHL